MIPVKGQKGLFRDEKTNAIINDDDISYEEYMRTKKKLIENQKKIYSLEEEIIEIKKLLNSLIKNK